MGAQTRTKIVALLLAVTLLFTGGLAVFVHLQQRQIDVMEDARRTERIAIFDRLMQLQGNTLHSFTYDYSYWDDMVRFLASRDPQWASINIDSVLPSFQLQAAWVFDVDLRPTYAVTTIEETDASRLLPVPREDLLTALRAKPFSHFFARTERGLMEIRAAPIQPSADSARVTPAQGYLLAGRLWDPAYLDELSELSESRLTVLPAAGAPPAAADGGDVGTTRFEATLPAWDGSPLARIDVVHESAAFKRWVQALHQELVLFVIFALLLLLLVSYFTRRWVSRPLLAISSALQAQNADALGGLHGQGTEFGRIAELIRDFFAQRNKLVEEIEERRQLQAELLFMANHDALTGLPNRSLFRERLEQALLQAQRRGERVAVLYVDLDRFKSVNDSIGHHAGDRVLKAVAARLSECVRHSDTVARLGGDEFVICLNGVATLHDASQVAVKILATLAHPIGIDGNDLAVACSIGISACPDDGLNAETLLRHADSALNHAKARGRNNFQIFDTDIKDKHARRLSVESGLRVALERGELSLHYQPRAELEGGRIVSVEALLRWRHPQLGVIPPSTFIPIAEESGLIVPIGEWVLRTACEQNKRWQNAGLPALRVAVNISPRQFMRRDFAGAVVAVLERTGLAPQHLELEVTESLLMQNFEAAAAAMIELTRIGARFAIDDFGVGYSSLSYLKRLPIHTVKIDRSFIRDLHSDSADAALVKAIITMAVSLKMRTVAEGVETEQQRDILRFQGCHEYQGYFLCRPLPADELILTSAEGKVEMVAQADQLALPLPHADRF